MVEIKTEEQMRAMSDDELREYFKELGDEDGNDETAQRIAYARILANHVLEENYRKKLKEYQKKWGSQIKPCPFCGSKRVEISVPYGTEFLSNVICKECGASSAWMDEPDEAFEIWNTRYVDVKEDTDERH